jgi:putative hemolysin
LSATSRPQEEQAEPDVVQRADGSWLADGMLPIERFKDLFALKELPDEDSGLYNTIGGFVTTHLGRIPTKADHLEFAGLRFEVVDMDGHRVDQLLVLRIPAPTASELGQSPQ